MPPSRRKCVYPNCGKSKAVYPELTLFTFPVKNRLKCEAWARNCGNLTILDSVSLSQKVVCENHFNPSEIFQNAVRKSLYASALPIPFTGTLFF